MSPTQGHGSAACYAVYVWVAHVYAAVNHGYPHTLTGAALKRQRLYGTFMVCVGNMSRTSLHTDDDVRRLQLKPACV